MMPMPNRGYTYGYSWVLIRPRGKTNTTADLHVFGALGGIRTPNLLIRSQML